MHSLKHLISAVIQESWVSQITESALDQTFVTGDNIIGLHFAFYSLCTSVPHCVVKRFQKGATFP